MTASLTITLDFELGWGAIENGLWKDRENHGVYDNLRLVMPQMLDILVELEIPVTWATVGGMVDESVKKNLNHLPLPIRELTKKALREAKPSSFDGRDLVELVEKAPRQRFASHSYSHVRFSYPNLSREFVESEMEHCNRVWMERDWGINTLVFPQNHEGFYDMIAAYGIERVRGAEIEHGRGWIQKVVANIIQSPPVSRKSIRDGLEVHTGSLFFKVPSGSGLRMAVLKMQAMRALNLATRENKTVHVYLHPFNLAESQTLFVSFIDFLQSAVKLRDQGKLDIAPFF